MRRNAAGDEIESLVLERQGLRLGIGDAQVSKRALADLLAHDIEHFLGDVGCPHARDMRREGVRRMAGAGRHIEHLPVWLRLRQFDQPIEALALGVRLAREIAARGSTELFLYQRFRHCSLMARQS